MVLPITFYEPFTVLMKPAEQMFFYDGFTEAAKAQEKDSSYRMMLITLSLIQGYYVVPNRIGKPINPQIGETYELVTPKFRFFSEHVSNIPSVAVMNCQGEGYEFRRTLEWE